MYECILVATDGSDVAAEATEHAIHLAKQNDALLYVVHVVDPDTMPSDVSSLSVDRELVELSEGLVDDAVERSESDGVEAQAAVLTGTPHVQILKYARDHDVDLIVLGRHGRRGVSRVVLGSVAENVIRRSEIPVLTVHLHTAD